MSKQQLSYPKNKINVLVLENIHPNAIEMFRQEGYNVEFHKSAMDENELIEKIKDVHLLCIRSKTNVTRKVLEHANRLLTVGAFCIGTNQIDLKACQEKGIVAFNAPYSNTRSVAELAIGEIIMLMRRIFDKSVGMHQGKWDKSANNSFEVRGKNLGIIGYGNIGKQLSILAEAMGMHVYYYDVVEKLTVGNAVKCKTLKELLNVSDVVSLHVDGRPDNKNFFGKAEFEEMKQGSYFLNLARGHVVDIQALVENIKSGKILGAAIDVFPYEPKNNDEEFISELRGLPNVILTPHIGGSTLEAQVNIAEFVPTRMINYVNTGDTLHSVNFPQIQLPKQQDAHRLLHIHKNVSGVLAQINGLYSKYNINILGQYLKTNENIGYVITDVDRSYSKELIEDLKHVENTIKFRVLY